MAAAAHVPATASTVAKRFISHLNSLLTFAAKMHSPRVGFLTLLLPGASEPPSWALAGDESR
jgi:hypothetical protein